MHTFNPESCLILLKNPESQVSSKGKKSQILKNIWGHSILLDYEWSPFFLRDSRVSKMRAPFSRWVIFTRARMLLALLSLRKNGDYRSPLYCGLLASEEVF